MKSIEYGGSGTRRRRLVRLGVVALCLSAAIAKASVLDVGVLSYDTFLPAANGSPGVFAFDLSNLTAAYSLPPDFPVSDSLTFGSAALTLTLSDLSQDVIPLGDIGPGFLLDQNGNPIVQVPGNQAFDSAEFTATLSPLMFALSDGTSFTADSSSIDSWLLPSSGTTLTVDVDNTTIGVSGTVQTASPEPSPGYLVPPAMCGLVWHLKRKRQLMRVRERV